ncbi:MAG: hypothetical protein BM563_06375 [Bacteroidetes bacterium MedPE-SWsnd-G1]|nr:MAG: hypothetical protein BM563_06375 [Bacteroidetes bacterium MedPE-SWsnd-G1]
MKFKLLFSLFFLMQTLNSFSSGLPKNIHKKVTKEIASFYDVKDFELKSISVSDELNSLLIHPIKEKNLFQIIISGELVGYAYVAKAPSKTDEFDYLVLFDKDLIITRSKLLIYREDYGAEIGSKRWLKQFIGLKEGANIEYGNQIVPISGATISAESITIAINQLLQSIAILNENGLFN